MIKIEEITKCSHNVGDMTNYDDNPNLVIGIMINVVLPITGKFEFVHDKFIKFEGDKQIVFIMLNPENCYIEINGNEVRFESMKLNATITFGPDEITQLKDILDLI